ncbi:ABC transporter permease [Desulforhabdus sp. TSK]|uniref:ABC transporter permease n=1 Tax=Desulforhabdus sp. TSK TaxID=2925014 RepID=UPI001FC7D215|nr:ABC transporter permease [Desulforhabdus sp. TSK]GKT10732.1 transport permease protein [Desulforhabdus sp. TSK]
MSRASLIWELTKRDFSEKFAGSVLGFVWSLILPIVNLVIYMLIFGKIMGGRLPGKSDIYAYGVYVTVGLVPWMAFVGSISRASNIFLEKRNLISKVSIPLPSLLVYVNLAEAITFMISMGFFFIFLFFTHHKFDMNMLLVPFLFYLQQLFAFGFGLLAATLTVFLRDIKEVITLTLQFWFWFTPIVYVRDILPDAVKSILPYNPAYVIIESYQRIFVFGTDPNYQALIVMTLCTHLLLFFSYWTLRALEKDVRDFL